MSFTSVLSDVKKGFERFFGDAIKVAEVAEPFVDVLFPGAAALYNSAVAEAAKVEAASIAAGKQSGTGPQKLAALVTAITPQVLAYAEKNGLGAITSEHITNYANAAVATLNALPAKL